MVSIFAINMSLYLSQTAIITFGIFCVIARDEMLGKHYLLVLYCCVWYFLACFILTFSRHCVLRRKHEATNKPVSKLYDSDLESDDETTVNSKKASEPLQWMHNFYVLCKYRPIYALVSLTVGLIFGIFSCLYILSHYVEEPIMKKDLRSAGRVTFATTLCVQCVVFIAARYHCLPGPTKSPYKPFDESIRIPMRVFMSKYVAFLSKEIFYIIGSLFLQFAAIYCLVKVYNMSEEDIKRFKEGSKYDNIRKYMIYTMSFVNFCSFLIILEGLARAYYVTKYILLGTFEKNWRRNMKACEYLLPNTEVNSLEDLCIALREKCRQPQLTEVEKKTIQYIERPLWKTKRAFVYRPDSVGPEQSGSSLTQNGSPRNMPSSQTSPRRSRIPPAEASPPLTRSRARQQ